MSITKVVLVSLAMAFAVNLVALPAPSALAIDWDAWRAERAAAREARDAERAAEKAAKEAEKAAEEAKKNDPTCTCRATLGLAKPTLQWSGDTLKLVPKVDITIRSSGDFDAPHWHANLAYEGSSSYASSDVATPGGVAFSGSQNVAGGFCGMDFNHKGYSLPEVSLSGLTRSLVGLDQELEGTVRLKTTLTGCGDAELQHKQAGFGLRELGGLKIGSWRLAR